MVPRQDFQYSVHRSTGQYNVLTINEVEHFIKHGWLKLSNCFTRKQADEVCANVWNRLRMDPKDVTTWHTEWQSLPGSRDFEVRKFAPRAWEAICDLLREERIEEWNDTWSDDLIVNLGSPDGAGKDIGPRDIDSWHIDGDHFVHFLDSPEQGLLVVPLWTNISKSCGGTMICPDAIPLLAFHMYDHPEGVMPDMTPKGNRSESYEDFYNNIAQLMPDESFVEITGEVGDVYFLHPLMMHTTSNNKLRRLRIISNPNVQLQKPFNFARKDPSQYSVVELSTKQALGNENLKSWRITGVRESIETERDSQRDDREEYELNALPRLRARSDSSGSSHGSDNSESSNNSGGSHSENGSDSDSDSDSSSRKAGNKYRKETIGQASVSFLKGVLNPMKHNLKPKAG